MHSTLRTIDDMMNISDNMMGCGFTSYKNIFNIKHHLPKDKSHTLEEIAKLTGYKKKGLQTIFNKGVGAYHTNPQSVRKQVKSPEQWAMGRVYASINPTSKAYQVDKSHLKRGGMIGGMAKYNAEGEIVERLERRDNPEDEIQAETLEITNYIDTINEDDNLTNKQKFNEIMKQVGDLKELYKVSDITETDKDFIKSKINHINNVLNEDKYDNFDVNEYVYKTANDNPLFNRFQKEAENTLLKDTETADTKRGDISEDKIINFDTDTGILEDYDNNKNTPFNSKELYGYDPQYIKKLLKKNNFNKPKEIEDANDDLKDKIRDFYLQYYPVDVIKDGTIWELKSYSKPTKTSGNYHNNQEMQRTKIEGTPRYQILYNQLANGRWVIGNIYDTKENMKTLPDKPSGYKYYWGYNSKDGIANTNPLESPNFRPQLNDPVLLNGKTYYKGGWNPNMSFTRKDKNNKDINYIAISNKELKREPRRYSRKYNKRIK